VNRATYRTSGIEENIANLVGSVLEEQRTVDSLSLAMVEALETDAMQAEIRKMMLQSGAIIFGAVLAAYVVGRMVTK